MPLLPQTSGTQAMSSTSTESSNASRRLALLRHLWPRRKWLQISLRTFLLAIVALAIWLAWLTDRARRQERLVNKVIAFGGGDVLFTHEVGADGKRTDANAVPSPPWLRQLVGDHYFFTLHSVYSNGLDDDDLKELANFPSVELLQLGQRHTDRGMQHIVGLKNLRTIDIESHGLTDESLTYFAQLPKLQTLAVTGARISDDGLMPLSAATNLKYLGLMDTCVTQAGVNRLKQSLPDLQIGPDRFPSAEEEAEIVGQLVRRGARLGADRGGYVQSVKFIGAQFVDDDLEPLGGLLKLKHLFLLETRISRSAIMELLAKHPELRVMPRINAAQPDEERALAVLQSRGMASFDHEGYVQGILFSADVTDDCLAAMNELARLKSVAILKPNIIRSQVARLGRMTALERLTFETASLSNDDLRELQGLDQLKELWVGGPAIDDAGLAHLQGMSKLETLTLSNTSITGLGLAQLQSMPNLQVLRLRACRVNDRGLSEVGKLTGLKKLYLDGAEVTDKGIPQLAPLSQLEMLSLKHCDISDATLPTLATLPALRWLWLNNTRVSSAGVEQFSRQSPKCLLYH
jgi:Leucine-rich repeat (LRR) protein